MSKWGIGNRVYRALGLFCEVLFLCIIVFSCYYALGRSAYATGKYAQTEFATSIDGTTVPIWYKLNIEQYFYDDDGNPIVNPYQVDPTKPMIALTFDDGPGKYTGRLLKLLQKYDARATFFMVGENIAYYPETVEQMKEIGCEYGNHTWSHKDLTKLKKKGIEGQLKKTDKQLVKVTGEMTTLARPPYGAVDKKVRKHVKSPLVLWSMDTLDWKRKDAKKIANYVLKHVEDGEIVLLHDIHKETVEAVEIMLPKLIKKGYQIVTVSEMAYARGVTLKDGEKYFEFYPE